MPSVITRARHAAAAGIIAVAVSATLMLPADGGVASASPVTGSDRNGTYLALGDSVAFGYVPPEAVPPPDYLDAHSFVGYPEDVARQLDVRVANSGCPGETTASMLATGAQSNGCENSVGSASGYRTLFPLHVQYQGTQMAYALRYLADHHHTRLVSIDIGANDVFVCERTTADHCTSQQELTKVATQIAGNLAAIYTQIRKVAGYQGTLVGLTYYSPSYSDPSQVAGTQFLDGVIANVTTAFGGLVADGFTAFQGPALAAGGDPCAAGLLIKLPGGTCNIHPSPLGHLLLARAIEQVLPPSAR
jgi:lysophospholipase L1-like esterase